MSRRRDHRMWLLSIESLGSLIWVVALLTALVIAVLDLVLHRWEASLFGFAVGWGIAIAVVATVQVGIALLIGSSYDPRGLWAFLLGPVFPLWFWMVGAVAAVHSQVPALLRGPQRERVVWDIPRERLGGAPGPGDASREA